MHKCIMLGVFRGNIKITPSRNQNKHFAVISWSVFKNIICFIVPKRYYYYKV